MNNRNLLKTINKKLSNDNLCQEFNIPLKNTIQERFSCLKYNILENWSFEESQKYLIVLFGLGNWKNVYLLLKEGI